MVEIKSKRKNSKNFSASQIRPIRDFIEGLLGVGLIKSQGLKNHREIRASFLREALDARVLALEDKN